MLLRKKKKAVDDFFFVCLLLQIQYLILRKQVNQDVRAPNENIVRNHLNIKNIVKRILV